MTRKTGKTAITKLRRNVNQKNTDMVLRSICFIGQKASTVTRVSFPLRDGLLDKTVIVAATAADSALECPTLLWQARW